MQIFDILKNCMHKFKVVFSIIQLLWSTFWIRLQIQNQILFMLGHTLYMWREISSFNVLSIPFTFAIVVHSAEHVELCIRKKMVCAIFSLQSIQSFCRKLFRQKVADRRRYWNSYLHNILAFLRKKTTRKSSEFCLISIGSHRLELKW